MTVRTSRAAIAPPKLLAPRPAACRIGGHDAMCEIGRANLGLFGTKPYSVLHIAHRCETTERFVDLRFMHKGTEQMLEALLPPLERARCH
jgi:hypothetical protein